MSLYIHGWDQLSPGTLAYGEPIVKASVAVGGTSTQTSALGTALTSQPSIVLRLVADENCHFSVGQTRQPPQQV